MRRPFTAARALALLGVVTLAGCKTTSQEVTENIPADFRQRHPIAIKEGARTHEVFIGTNRGSLTPVQRAEIAALAGSWRKEATGGIVISVPAGTHNARAAATIQSEVRSILTAGGVPPHSIVVRPYQPDNPAKLATVKVSYPKMIAEAGPCGLWPHDLGPSWNRGYNENRQYYNFGCATQRNLAVMVANPADLEQPREESPIYSMRRTTVVEKYRRGEGPATLYPDDKKGKISDVGQ